MIQIIDYKIYEKPVMKADSVTGIIYSDYERLKNGYGSMIVKDDEECERIEKMIIDFGGKVIGTFEWDPVNKKRIFEGLIK